MLLSIGFIVYDGCTVCKALIDEIKEKVKLDPSNYEIIIIDFTEKNAPDGLSDISKELKNVSIKLYKCPNRGTFEGRKLIAKVARGNYVWMLDNDDHLYNDITSFLFIGDYDIIQCQAEVPTAKGYQLIGPEVEYTACISLPDSRSYIEYKSGNSEAIYLWSKFIKRQLLVNVYLSLPVLDNVIWFEDDIVLYMMYKQHPEINTHFIPYPIYRHVRSESSMTVKPLQAVSDGEIAAYYNRQICVLESGIRTAIEYLWSKDKYLTVCCLKRCIDDSNPHIVKLGADLMIRAFTIEIL